MENRKTNPIVFAQQKAEDKLKELDKLMDYPPFQDIDDGADSWKFDGVNPIWGFPFDTERGADLKEAMKDAIRQYNSELIRVGGEEKMDADFIAKMWDGVFKEFSDEIDEARLYAKRFDDSVEALISAHKMK